MTRSSKAAARDAPDPINDLVARFDESLPCISSPCPKPTAAQIAAIEGHFDIALPSLLIELANRSKNFSAVFLGLASEDAKAPGIISTNSHWRRRRRTRRLPKNLVIITDGFMDHRFWCLDRDAKNADSGEPALQFWCPDEILYASESDRPTERYPNFRSFVEADIYWRTFHARG